MNATISQDPYTAPQRRHVTQAWCDRANALREFEAAHAIWMGASVFTPAGVSAKAAKDAAMQRYAAAVAAHEQERRQSMGGAK